MPKERPRRKDIGPDHAKLLMQFLGAAFNDYIAARVLLNAELLVQGAVLASTALEKYLKAVLALNGNVSRGHLKKAHWNALKNLDPERYRRFDSGFLELCQKCYKMRYPDDLPPGYNVVLVSTEFLAELDYSAALLEDIFKLEKGGAPQVRMYDIALANKDERLILNNHVVSGEGKGVFLARVPQLVYEVRNLEGAGLMEVTYRPTSAALREGFMREALVTRDGRSFATAFKHPPTSLEA